MAGSTQNQARIILSAITVAVVAGFLALGYFVFVSGDESGGSASPEATLASVPEVDLGSVPNPASLREGLSERSIAQPFLEVDGFSFVSPDNVYWYPSSQEHGPSIISATSSSGFAQTREGAGLAASHIYYRTTPVNEQAWRDSISTQTVGPGVGDRVADGERFEGRDELISLIAGTEFVAGWDLIDFSEADATVDVYYAALDIEGYSVRRLRVVWDQQSADWKLFVPEDNDYPLVKRVSGPLDVRLEGAFR